MNPTDTERLPINRKDWETCLEVLHKLVANPEAALDQRGFERLIARIYKGARRLRRKRSKQQRILFDQALVSQTGRVRSSLSAHPASRREDDDPCLDRSRESSAYRSLQARSRVCYICRHRYRDVHAFYHMLCPACAERNFEKRHQRADLAGRTALVTGGRIKIGFQTALKLLRDGARVLITTRFPRDAARQYASQPDFACWSERLAIHAVDFRNLPAVLRFVERLLQQLPALDILVNNAAQSVKRSAEYHENLLSGESQGLHPANLESLIRVHPPQASSVRFLSAVPNGEFDQKPPIVCDGSEIAEPREENSWTHRLEDVSPLEFLEVFLVYLHE